MTRGRAIPRASCLKLGEVRSPMGTSRFFEWFQFGVLVCFVLVGLTRAILLYSRGTPVVVADRQRTLWQMLVDMSAGACLLVWAYEVVAYAWGLRFHVGPTSLHRILADSVRIKVAGAVFVSVALVLYAVAVHHLGKSWRLGIDRTAPGPLVTDGVYRWTRHPIYIGFDLLFVGTFLVLGRGIFLLLALVWIPLMHQFMLREERFLSELYDGAYRDYCRRVGRYPPWRTRA